MRVMVFDVPASTGGALSILNEFYLEVKEKSPKDVEWIFVLSMPELEETENIKVLRFPWVKKSWFHRLYFDRIVAPKLVEKHNIDKIFSLQNIIIPKVEVNQVLYVHQPLPFSKYKFKFKENKLFWIYQNIISKSIFSSIKKANKVVVQTKWMKEACMEKVDGIHEDNIFCIFPKIQINSEKMFEVKAANLNTFFYPASGVYYKNHRLIIEVCRKLKTIGITDKTFIFTLNGEENDHIKELYKIVESENLPVKFIGSITVNQVYEYFSKYVLIFPSYIETFGLPLLECRMLNGIILASDTEFSREILGEYSNAYYFNPFQVDELVGLIKDSKFIDYQEEMYKREVQKNLISTIVGE